MAFDRFTCDGRLGRSGLRERFVGTVAHSFTARHALTGSKPDTAEVTPPVGTNPSPVLHFAGVRHWNNDRSAERDTQFRYRRHESDASRTHSCALLRYVQGR